MKQEDFYAQAQFVARKLFETDGRVDMMAAVVGTLNPTNGEPLDPEEVFIVVPDALTTESHKDAFAYSVRVAAKTVGATLVATIYEAWLADVSGLPKEDAHKVRASKQPNRKEIVLISIEGREGVTVHQALITRDENGKGTLQPFEDIGVEKVEGRLSRLLPEHWSN